MQPGTPLEFTVCLCVCIKPTTGPIWKTPVTGVDCYLQHHRWSQFVVQLLHWLFVNAATVQLLKKIIKLKNWVCVDVFSWDCVCELPAAVVFTTLIDWNSFTASGTRELIFKVSMLELTANFNTFISKQHWKGQQEAHFKMDLIAILQCLIISHYLHHLQSFLWVVKCSCSNFHHSSHFKDFSLMLSQTTE